MALLLLVGSSAARSPDLPAASISAVIAASAAATPTLTPSGGPISGSPVGGPVPHIGTNLVSVGKPTVSGTTATATVGCPSSPATTCVVTLKLTVVETLTNGKLTAVTAAAKKQKRTATVGTATVTIAAGRSVRAKVKLNTFGKHLLASRGKLSATLTTSQKVAGAGSVAAKRQTVKFKKH